MTDIIHQSIFSLSPAGYFLRDGKRLVPVGANYWPGSCGVELWPAWPEHELQHDLDTLAKLQKKLFGQGTETLNKDFRPRRKAFWLLHRKLP